MGNQQDLADHTAASIAMSAACQIHKADHAPCSIQQLEVATIDWSSVKWDGVKLEYGRCWAANVVKKNVEELLRAVELAEEGSADEPSCDVKVKIDHSNPFSASGNHRYSTA